jgi:hypothetical protein
MATATATAVARGASVADEAVHRAGVVEPRLSRTDVQLTSSTPTVASANAGGIARPAPPAVPCGSTSAAVDGALSATEIPMTSRTSSSRRSLVPFSSSKVP